MAGTPPRTPLGELTALPQTPLLHWGGEEKGKGWKGIEDRKAEERGREGHGEEEVRGEGKDSVTLDSLLIGTSGSNSNKLQHVQNCLARVVLQDNNNSATSLLSELHWLPVNKRINFKIATLAYQSLAFWSATYLSAVLTPRHATSAVPPLS